jgi:hypothetical protein
VTHLKELLMLVMGAGLILVALQGAVRGWLPNGSKGLQQGEGVSREERPVLFWFFFALYAGGGGAVMVYALRHF